MKDSEMKLELMRVLDIHDFAKYRMGKHEHAQETDSKYYKFWNGIRIRQKIKFLQMSKIYVCFEY